MRLAALVVFGGCSDAQTPSAAVVMAVGSLDPVTNVETWTHDVDDPTAQTWRGEPFDVPRANFVTSEADFEPLRVRVDLPHAGHWVIRLVGHGGGEVLQYTGCYTVSGVVENDFVVLGRIAGNDEDADGYPDDDDAYCTMLQAAGAPCPAEDDLGVCPPTYAEDCAPDVARIHPLAADTCGNGEDEDCDGVDTPCIDCEDPANRDRPECSGDCGVCNPPEGCCGGACVDLSSSASNCGACGTSCVTERTDSCDAGLCTCGGGDPCGAASACTAGACVCDAGRGDCDVDPGNGCETDLLFDSDHCGDCETSCDTSCVDGACL